MAWVFDYGLVVLLVGVAAVLYLRQADIDLDGGAVSAPQMVRHEAQKPSSSYYVSGCTSGVVLSTACTSAPYWVTPATSSTSATITTCSAGGGNVMTIMGQQ